VSALAWTAALSAVAIPNLVFAWRKQRAEREPHDEEPQLSARQRRRWVAVTQVVWVSPSVAFWVLLYFAGLPLQDALFWSILMLAGGLNLLVMAAVVFAVVTGRQRGD
jgi:hypothetical protein